ncbi:MAG: ATP-binding cassette domain-containing protein [Elusimicrobia bacterium]|nr:ATP-binding cassette domain-containing protein [Candidatus Obscuribacterium magneticum]
MIHVQNLTKRFGATVAVDGISFDIPQGQLVGFLGPNGAGKTTTMRLLTGYLPPDEGAAQLMGHDLLTDSLAIRRRLGYLPENNPLPEDIETTEYLHFVGRLRGLVDTADRMQRVKKVLKTCSLESVVGRKLGELSKGFRQRVGLAQAIIHDPDVLILDEPTSGLDPNQVQEVRHLIQELKKQKTLILSTHILHEVQHTCDRVIIINKGKIVADGSPSDLSGHMQNIARLFVALRGPMEEIMQNLRGISGVTHVEQQKSKDGLEEGFVLESDASRDVREDVFRLAVARNWVPLSIHYERLSLEDVFKALTVGETIPGEGGFRG